MRINKLDLTKVISDFMFLWVAEPEEKAKVIFRIKHKLTPHWFEKYMEYYFKKLKGYDIKLNWNTNSLDWGIDLIWSKNVNWREETIAVQCKKYTIRDINEDNVRSFMWALSLKFSWDLNNTTWYYITTSKFTDKAKLFWKQTGMKLVDFSDIYNLQFYYSIEDFEKDIMQEEWSKAYYKAFNEDQMTIDLEIERYDTAFVSDKDVFQLLKQIRRDYSHQHQLRLWDMAKNDTLEILARERPHNMDSLRKSIYTLPIREKNKLDKYWPVFIERLKYISQNQENSSESLAIFDRLIDFMRRK